MAETSLRRRLLEALLAVALEESVRGIFPLLLPYVWFGILWGLTLEILNSKQIKAKAVSLQKSLERKGKVLSYVMVAIIGSCLSLAYWYGVTKAYDTLHEEYKNGKDSDAIATSLAKRLYRADLHLQQISLIGITEIHPKPTIQLGIKNAGNAPAKIFNIDYKSAYIAKPPQDFLPQFSEMFNSHTIPKSTMNYVVGATDVGFLSFPLEGVNFQTPNDAIHPAKFYYALGRVWYADDSRTEAVDFCYYIPAAILRRSMPEYTAAQNIHSTGNNTISVDMFAFANIWLDCMSYVRSKRQ